MSGTSAPRPLSSPRAIAYTFGDLHASAEISERTGVSEGRIRSLRDHPLAAPDDIAILASVDDPGSTATLSLIPGRMRIDGQVYRIDWGSGWSARPDGSAAGAGLLLRAIRSASSFGGHLLSNDALRVYRAARAQLVRIPRAVLLLRSTPYWLRLAPSPVAAVLSLPTDALARAVATVARSLSRRGEAGYVFDEVERFDERLDGVDTASGERFAFIRDHRELNWAMASPWDPHAGLRYRCFHLRRTGSPEILGYAWVRLRTYGTARVASLFRTGIRSGHRVALGAILDGVLDALRQDDVDLIDIAGSDAVLLAAARRRGFLSYGHIDQGCVFAPEVSRALARAGATLASFRSNMAEGDVLFL